ncbi:hypothetical protein ULG90_01400 [Halopseudomonas pachastrellae]|nr:hypothetical protein ULG90_01400 [Halopseudomonas pachastrellae]
MRGLASQHCFLTDPHAELGYTWVTPPLSPGLSTSASTCCPRPGRRWLA